MLKLTKKYSVWPLTDELLIQYYEFKPAHELEGLALMDALEQPIAIAGILLYKEYAWAFSECKINPRTIPITAVKFAKVFLQMMRQRHKFILSYPEDDDAVRFHKFLGAKSIEGGYCLW